MSEYPELIHIKAGNGMLVTVDILEPEIYRPLSNREIKEVARRFNSHKDLLEACEEFVRLSENYSKTSETAQMFLRQILGFSLKTKATIAKAKPSSTSVEQGKMNDDPRQYGGESLPSEDDVRNEMLMDAEQDAEQIIEDTEDSVEQRKAE